MIGTYKGRCTLFQDDHERGQLNRIEGAQRMLGRMLSK